MEGDAGTNRLSRRDQAAGGFALVKKATSDRYDIDVGHGG